MGSSLEHRMIFTNNKGVSSTIQKGCKKKHADLPDGTVVIPVEYKLIVSDLRMKENAAKIAEEKHISVDKALKQVPKSYYVKLLYLAILPGKQEPVLCHSPESSLEIVEFYMLVNEGKASIHQRLHKCSENNKIFYKEYHVSEQDAVQSLASMDEFKNLIY